MAEYKKTQMVLTQTAIAAILAAAEPEVEEGKESDEMESEVEENKENDKMESAIEENKENDEIIGE